MEGAPSLSHAGSFKAASELSEGNKQQSLSPEQKDLLLRSRVVMFIMLIIFVTCSLFELVRVFLCILLLTTMGLLSCHWEEDSYLATSDGGAMRRLQMIVCQGIMVLIPLGTSGWMAFIFYAMATRTDNPPFSDDELDLFPTPPLLEQMEVPPAL